MNWREIVVDAVWYALGGIARRRWDGRRRKTGPIRIFKTSRRGVANKQKRQTKTKETGNKKTGEREREVEVEVEVEEGKGKEEEERERVRTD